MTVAEARQEAEAGQETGAELDELARACACVLFVAAEPVPAGRLAEILGVDSGRMGEVLGRAGELLRGAGLQVIGVAGGYAIATLPEYADYVARYREPPKERLSQAALEVLAIIAYRQPVTKPEIDEIRGVDSSSPLRQLVAKGLVAVSGRKKAPGRPLMFVTTEQFLKAFGLKDLSELPELDELSRKTGQYVLPMGGEAAGEGGVAEEAEAGGGSAKGAGERGEAGAESAEGAGGPAAEGRAGGGAEE